MYINKRNTRFRVTARTHPTANRYRFIDGDFAFQNIHYRSIRHGFLFSEIYTILRIKGCYVTSDWRRLKYNPVNREKNYEKGLYRRLEKSTILVKGAWLIMHLWLGHICYCHYCF